MNKSPNIDEAALAALLKGSSIRIDDATSIQIYPAEVDEHGNKHLVQLAEVNRAPEENYSWMDFKGTTGRCYELFFLVGGQNLDRRIVLQQERCI